jgi:4-azaleucine resistance transporter AzlC
VTDLDHAPSASPVDEATLAESRRRLLMEALGIAVSAVGFGFVYGLSAREAGFSPIEAVAMSVIVFGGAAQFAAVGYVTSGLAWPGVVLLTFLLNARHLLYSAALAPWLRHVPFWRRAVMAHLLTDEAFALSIGHFRRVGRTDERGYWIAAIASTFIPWNLATIGGVLLGAQIPDPARFGIDIIFPAAMIGLAVGLVTGRRELVAAIVGAGVGVGVALLTGPSIGIVAGGIVGPAVGLLVPETLARETAPLGTPASADRYAMPGTFVGRRVDGQPGPVGPPGPVDGPTPAVPTDAPASPPAPPTPPDRGAP